MRMSNVLYTNRPMLFIGCSLEEDRTVTVLEAIKAQNPYLQHFAILAAKDLASALDSRRERLAQCGIRPLWFPPGEFKRIGILLDDLVDRASVDALPSRPRARREAPPLHDRGPFRPLDPALNPHLENVATAIAGGRVAFFLGAGIHDRRLHGDEFYEELARRTGATPSSKERANVADYLANTVGRALLCQKVEEIIVDYTRTRDAVHDLMAALPRALEAAGPPGQRPLLVLTTNYDDVLERSFEATRTPYHLFIYRPDDRTFVHRTPAGALRGIRRPEGVYRLAPEAPVIVKLNGGVDPEHELPPSFAVGTRDFAELAYRIPAVLPQVLRALLTERSLLFLGHGLNELDVRKLAAFSKEQRRFPESWAVVHEGWDLAPHRKADEEDWRDAYGVRIVRADLGDYVPALRKRLSEHFGVHV